MVFFARYPYVSPRLVQYFSKFMLNSSIFYLQIDHLQNNYYSVLKMSWALLICIMLKKKL